MNDNLRRGRGAFVVGSETQACHCLYHFASNIANLSTGEGREEDCGTGTRKDTETQWHKGNLGEKRFSTNSARTVE